nr:hypothetical protein I302_06121 [Kwoniella bestiolae CBS 10118]OCF24660.1 hypothetical protein I302_06121 [Kwoniella bestiolae CBS 10118]
MSSSSKSSSSLFLPFDPNSPVLVAKGVLATGTLGAITGASIGVIQTKNPFALSINMTINLSIAGLTFFSIREYLVSPLLLSLELTPSHSRRLSKLKEQGLSAVQRGKLPAAPIPSLSEVRWDRLSDSAIAGGLTGGVLSAAFRGRATFLKAGITSSLIASILQISINQARVIRLKTLAKQSTPSLPQSASMDDPSATTILPGKDDQVHSQISQSFEQPLKPPLPTTIQEAESQKPTFPEKMMNSLTKFLPVRKLTNEEYVETLEKKRMEVDKRLREIDDEEKRMYDWAQAQNQSYNRS